MINLYAPGKTGSLRRYLLLLSIAFFLSCGTTREANVLDRSGRPEVIAGVPEGTSEIREVKYHKTSGEIGHEVLHLRGQLFTKKPSGGGSVQISPCSGCVIQIATPNDPTITANVTTHHDGYFEYNGQIVPYTFILNNPGMNPLTIESVELDKEGFMTMKIILAAGTTPERFRITKTGHVYNWTKVQ
ncbi:MAG TPA: hypothetical protein VGE66_10675 [Chitinophagaceae bacterium]